MQAAAVKAESAPDEDSKGGAAESASVAPAQAPLATSSRYLNPSALNCAVYHLRSLHKDSASLDVPCVINE